MPICASIFNCNLMGKKYQRVQTSAKEAQNLVKAVHHHLGSFKLFKGKEMLAYPYTQTLKKSDCKAAVYNILMMIIILKKKRLFESLIDNAEKWLGLILDSLWTCFISPGYFKDIS